MVISSPSYPLVKTSTAPASAEGLSLDEREKDDGKAELAKSAADLCEARHDRQAATRNVDSLQREH